MKEEPQIELMSSFPRMGGAVYEGLINMKLMHGNGICLLLSELIVIDKP
jgi:hypothetical protein